MIDPEGELWNRVLDQLMKCCEMPGTGVFKVRGERTSDSKFRHVIEGAPSFSLESDDGLPRADLRAGSTALTSFSNRRSLDAVVTTIFSLLCEVWHRAGDAGSVEVRCRRRPNGKCHFNLTVTFSGEIVLRPEEI